MSYRFILEKYRGISTRYTCPQCGRKHTFTRYIDTENNNNYLSDNVGKCNRLDKCGYHYTPREYFADNPWLSEKKDFPFSQNIGKWENGKRKIPQSKPSPRSIYTLPEWVVEWVKRIDAIAQEVGFDYTVSQFVETHAQANGDDVGDVVLRDYARYEE